MDFKELVNKIEKYQNVIVEVIILSLISGWFITSTIYGTFKPVDNIEYIKDMKIGSYMLIVALVSVMVGIVYSMNKSVAKVIMFASVYLYSILAIIGNKEKIYYVVVLGIVSALALTYVSKDILKLLYKIKVNNEKIGVICAVAIAIALVVFIGVITVLRYRTYSNSTFDFGIFAQMFENMKNTWHPTTTVERPEQGSFSHFGVHFSPIFYVLLPIYWISPNPATVQMMQAIVLGVAVIPLYFLCRHYNLSAKFSLVMCVIYCIFPATVSGTMYDFHENACIPVLIFSLVLAMEKKKNWAIIVSAVLLVMVKEDSAFYLLIIGVYFLLSKRDKIRGGIMSVAAMIYFVVAIKIVHSYGLGDLASTRYGHIMYDKNEGLGQIVMTLLVNPAYFLLQVLNEEKIQYFLLMVLPLGMALLHKRKYSRYILLGTFVVFNLVPMYQYMYNIGFQYSFGVVALMMYLAVMNVSEWKPARRNRWVLTSLVITSLLFTSFTLHKWGTYTKRYEDNKATIEKMDHALQMIPEKASVLTSGFIMPHLYYIEELSVIKGPVEVYQDYVVVDMRSGFSSDIDDVGDVLQQEYTMIYEVPDSLRLYKKNK